MTAQAGVLTPRELLVGAATTAGFTAAVAQGLGDGVIADAATVACLTQLVICGALLLRPAPAAGPGALGVVAAVGLAVLIAPTAWFFGPNAGLVGALTLAILCAGVLSGARSDSETRFLPWLVYGALALADAVIFVAVLSGALPDDSLSSVALAGHPAWHSVVAHAFLQALMLAAMLAGRAIARRYASLSLQLEESGRARATHRALTEEARAEYERVLVASRSGVLSTRALKGYRVEGLRAREATAEVYEAVDEAGATVTLRIEASGVELRVREQPNHLREWVAQRGSMTNEELGALAAELCAQLGDLHRRGLSHGAVQPENLRWRDGRWTLASGVPQEAYLAPEQLRGAAGPAADLHSAAAVLAYATLGEDPFADAAAVFGEPPRLPPSVSAPLLRAMNKAPDARPSPDELARELAECLDSPPPVRATPAPPRPSDAPDAARDEAYRAKIWVFTVALTVVLACSGALFVLLAQESSALVVGLLSMLVIGAAGWWHQVALWRTGRAGYLPWAIAAAFSAGPAYTIGLQSGMSAVLVLWLFAGGALPGQQRERRAWALVAMLVTHTALFVAIAAGLLPDVASVPLRARGSGWAAPVTLQLMLTALYALAYFAGLVIDRRHAEVTRLAEAEARAAAEQEVRLAAARDELDLARAAASGLFTGATLGGYVVGEMLGRGGMGEVYEARDASGAPIALKLLRGDRIAERWAHGQFEREAQALARVHSPHVARILDFHDGSAGVPFLAMERVEGRSLAARLRDSERLALEEARAMIAELARGLGDVHAAGLVHCDVKPANVIWTTERRWKLVDFGVARPSVEEDTESSVVAGTPGYMAPEQCRRGPVDGRADVLALCLVAYRALNGRPAFVASHPNEMLAQIALGMPRPSGRVPSAVADVIKLGAAYDREDRFATAEALAEAFEAAFENRLPPATRARADAIDWA